MPLEDFKSLYLEKLLNIYLYVVEALQSEYPNGDPLAKHNAAEAFASLLIFSTKSQIAYNQLNSDLDQFDLLDEMQDRFDMLYKTYEMGDQQP